MFPDIAVTKDLDKTSGLKCMKLEYMVSMGMEW